MPSATPGSMNSYAIGPFGNRRPMPAPPAPRVAPLNVAPNAYSIGQSQLSELMNANRQYGVGGSFTTPSGVNMEIPGTASGRSGASGSGASGDPAFDVNLSDLWSRTGMLEPPPTPTPLPGRVTGPSPADRQAAEAATYGRAKDKVGQETRASMNALANEMASRGLSDSSFMATGAANILQTGQQELADTNRSQAIDALKRAAEVEDRNYAGDVSQRGQDIGYNSQVDAARRQVFDARNALLARLMAIRQAGGRIY